MNRDVLQECDDARQGDYCTEGIIRHIQHERFKSTQWLCLKHKAERDALRDTPKKR